VTLFKIPFGVSVKKIWLKVLILGLGFVGILLLQRNLKNKSSESNQTLQLLTGEQSVPATVIIEKK
jgi:hypothetical protein